MWLLLNQAYYMYVCHCYGLSLLWSGKHRLLSDAQCCNLVWYKIQWVFSRGKFSRHLWKVFTNASIIIQYLVPFYHYLAQYCCCDINGYHCTMHWYLMEQTFLFCWFLLQAENINQQVSLGWGKSLEYCLLLW